MNEKENMNLEEIINYVNGKKNSLDRVAILAGVTITAMMIGSKPEVAAVSTMFTIMGQSVAPEIKRIFGLIDKRDEEDKAIEANERCRFTELVLIRKAVMYAIEENLNGKEGFLARWKLLNIIDEQERKRISELDKKREEKYISAYFKKNECNKDEYWNELICSIIEVMDLSEEQTQEFVKQIKIEISECYEAFKNQAICNSEIFKNYMISKELNNFNNGLQVLNQSVVTNKLSSDDNIKARYNIEWFSERLEESIENIDNRYSPELNIELNASSIIDAVEKNEKFKNNIKSSFEKILLLLNDAESTLIKSTNNTKERELLKLICEIRDICIELDIKNIKIDDLRNKLNLIEKHISNNFSQYRFKNEEWFDKFKKIIIKFNLYINNDYIKASENPFVLISGEAGIGKSHFLADQALKRKNEGKISVLLLGQLFLSNDNPLIQIKQQLRISDDENIDDFFKALNCYGEENNERVIIFLDALNEGQGKKIWINYLNGFVSKIKTYNWIGMIMSVRSTYEKEVISNNLLKNYNVIKFQLEGFDDIQLAIQKFFDYYNVPLKPYEMLRFQFKNPLFLKIYCIAYSNAESQKEMQDSIGDIFGLYLENKNKALAMRIEKYPKYENLIRIALNIIINYKLKTGEDRLSYIKIRNEINKEIKYYDLNINLLDELIDENLITINEYDEDKIIYVAYELFEDYLMAEQIIDENKLREYKNNTELNKFFSEENPYFNWIEDKFVNQGIFEALIIQVPDLFEDTDMFEFYKWPIKVLDYKNIDFEKALYNSLLWRNPKNIKEGVFSYVVNEIFTFAEEEPNLLESFFESLIQLTAVKNNVCNAEYLFTVLNKFSLVEFNRYWVTIISKEFNENFNVQTLIKWAWNYKESNSRLDDESIILFGMNLSWFLASTNRELRDMSTKALVNLFENKLELLLVLLKKFEYVKDLYILERLYCVAYGCVLRTRNRHQIKELALYVYKRFFLDDYIKIKHIMIRNYLLGILEFSIKKKIVDIDMEIIIPKKVEENIYYYVSDDDIEAYRKPYSEGSSDNVGPDGIYYEELYLYYKNQNIIIDSIKSYYEDESSNKKDLKDFSTEIILDYILPEDRENFCRMVIKEVFDMGYDYIKFGKNDLEYNLSDQANMRNKSLGQKYEWIALNKILSIYFDSTGKIYDFLSNRVVTYKGIWQCVPFRDIDPSSHYYRTIDYETEITSNAQFEKLELGIMEEFYLDYYLARNSKSETLELDKIKKILVSNIISEYDEKWLFFGGYDSLYFKEQIDIKIGISGEGNISNAKEELLVEKFKVYGGCLEGCYLKELYWSEAYKNIDQNIDQKTNRGITLLNELNYHFLWDETDGACCNAISIEMLNINIMNKLNLIVKDEPFEYYYNDEKVCFNEYIYNEDNNKLLIKEKFIAEYLKNNSLHLLWIFYKKDSNNDSKLSYIIDFDGDKFLFRDIINT